MKVQKKTRFKDEIRKILIFHALAPIAFITVLFLMILGFFWSHSIIAGSKSACQSRAEEMEQSGQAYLQEIAALAGQTDWERLQIDQDYRINVTSEIYQFLNCQQMRGEFYLLGAEEELLFSTDIDLFFRERILEQIRWRMIHSAVTQTEAPVLLLCQVEIPGGQDSVLLIGQKTAGNEKNTLCFAVPAAAFRERADAGTVPTLVANRFGRIFWESGGHFQDDMGKLSAELRGKPGFGWWNGTQYYIASQEVLDGRLCVYAVNESGSMFRTMVLLGLLVLILFLAMTTAVFFSARHISDRKTKIIDEIVDAFKNAEQGNLETRLSVSTNDEFEVIGSAYNIMLDSIRNLIKRNEEQAQQTVYFNLCQLQSQFNPHFLFNTLENVRFMIKLDTQAAEKMILSLSSLLRYSIRGGNETVTLREDIDYIQNYLTILSSRFGERFRYSIQIPESLLDAEIPRLIFQPAVENAVKYGMDAVEEILVTIRAVRQEETLLLSVEDNGPGIQPGQLQQIRDSLGKPTSGGSHIGLYNMNRRIVLMYGEPYGMELSSEENSGTTVTVSLPFRQRTEKNGKGEAEC